LTVEIRVLGPGDEAVLTHVGAGVFDHSIDPRLVSEFLHDPRHHLAVAVEAGVVVGFASGVHYIHPDKTPEMWIDEVGVAPTHQRQGVGQRVLRALLLRGAERGCREAWVLTSRSNSAAMRLYASSGGAEATEDSVMFTFDIPAS
jgi:ribosomal protein S18 acetylase RimI-like enzyme